jgi:hypothetical protein
MGQFCSGRESEPWTDRFALAMGEVVQRAGRFFLSATKAFRFALAMGEVVQRTGRLFSCAPLSAFGLLADSGKLP